MKINSAGRSDVFNEYIDIISKYNKKILKKGSLESGFANKFFGKSIEELASDLSIKSFKAAPIERVRFAAAGVNNLAQINKIFSLAKTLLDKKYVFLVNGSFKEIESPDFLNLFYWINNHPQESIKNYESIINKNISQSDSSFKKIIEVTEDNQVDIAKEIVTGSKFKGNELEEFKKIISEIVEEPPVAKPTTSVSPPTPTGGSADTSVSVARKQKGVAQQLTVIRDSTQDLLVDAKKQLEEAIRTGDDNVRKEVVTKLVTLEEKITNDLASVQEFLDQTNKNITSQVSSQAENLTEFKKSITQFQEQLENLKANVAAARGSVDSPSTAVANIVKGGKLTAALGYLWTALKISAGLGAAIAAAYYAYNWYYESGKEANTTENSEAGGTSRGRRAPSEESSINSEIVTNLVDQESRAEYFNKIDRMEDDQKKQNTLQQIVKAYNAYTYVKLDQPVVVAGELIRYVFPRLLRGGNLKESRIRATEKYFINVYSNPGKWADLIGTLQNNSLEKEGQAIANYAFSVMASEAYFSGRGTFLGLGNRGTRAGKGKGLKAVPQMGISGRKKQKITGEERRALREMAEEGSQASMADDIFSNNLDDSFYNEVEDPMDSFASGQEEYFKKISKNINVSTNKINSYEFAKKADKISNRYFKDAVEDLQDDEFMKAYYAGFSKLHNQKPKKQKPDYEKLYDLHDETGEELIHKAHPKAISVAEAIGNGGLVENESEKSKAMEDVAFRVPSGNYRARYAFIQNALKKKS